MTKNNDYDIEKAFKAIENELIASMIRNFDRHKAEEVKEGYRWSMWQAEQLKALEKYKRDNRKKYGKQFQDINAQISELIRTARSEGGMSQEAAILNAIKHGFPAKKISKGAAAEFFKLNDRKLNALIKATTNDMQKAETAILRMANDQYRKVIYNAQVYANTGAGTYEKAVDMATKDFLSAGLNCVEYANGARHTLSDYADMALRTASKRAYLTGEGEKRQEWGIHTVIMNKRGNPCPKCLPFVGKIMIDDVWSGGSRKDGPYQLMSTAIAAGLYHPRCRDSHTTYFSGISTPPDDKYTRQELTEIEGQAKQEAQKQYATRQSEKFGRLARFSMDGDNQKRYASKEDEWKEVAKSFESGIIKPENTKEVAGVHTVGNIDREIYKCITDDIVTDEVIITDNQLQHILDRHPDTYEKAVDYIKNVVESPDYIIEDKHSNTGLVIKKIDSEKGNLQLVLRICTSEDATGYKNSVISCWEISDKRLENYLRNKRVLYKKE